jgi:uncharacterized membrane protein
MIPDPLHPSVVHFPIVFAVLLPLVIVWALWAIRRGSPAGRAWALPVAAALLMAAGTWVAVQTGESEEDRVEDVVGEEPLHEHEEAGEQIRLLATGLFALTLLGFLSGTGGRVARVVALLGALVLTAAGVRTAHLGGELVYNHGAASAYTDGAAANAED